MEYISKEVNQTNKETNYSYLYFPRVAAMVAATARGRAACQGAEKLLCAGIMSRQKSLFTRV